MRIGRFTIALSGIWFRYKSDEILYVWRWRRKIKSLKWHSINLCAGFPTLKAMDKLNKECDEMCKLHDKGKR